MARRYYSTTAQRTTLASSCTDSATTIVVTAATGFPSSVPFPLVLDADTVNEEAVLVTSRVGTTCTVTRAYDGTTGVAHSAGATVRHAALALDFNEASEHVNETTTAHGLTLADVITTSNTKTLTNKTLTAPTIADFTNANHDHGDADDGGTLPASSVLNLPANAQTGTTYTFALADARKHVTASNSSSQTYTVPPQADVVWLADARIPLTNLGAGVVTVAAGSGVTLNGSDLTLAQGESAVLLRTASNVWWCLPFSTGSGALARGTLSGTTGSPATSANGGATAYKWTTAGAATFTVATAGLFSGVVVGGGGGGAGGVTSGGAGGGGGAGGVAVLTDFYLAAGTYNVWVGLGGAAGAAITNGRNGESSILGPFAAAGGGGGGCYTANTITGSAGGSGGGAAGGRTTGATGGLPTTGQGYAGGAGGSTSGGGPGGGGASAAGTASSAATGANGGAGVASSITGSSVTYGGGGGGGGYATSGGTAGTGGSGGGGAGGANGGAAGTAGTANLGGGGGGGGAADAAQAAGAAGGSGVVILLVGTV